MIFLFISSCPTVGVEENFSDRVEAKQKARRAWSFAGSPEGKFLLERLVRRRLAAGEQARE